MPQFDTSAQNAILQMLLADQRRTAESRMAQEQRRIERSTRTLDMVSRLVEQGADFKPMRDLLIREGVDPTHVGLLEQRAKLLKQQAKAAEESAEVEGLTKPLQGQMVGPLAAVLGASPQLPVPPQARGGSSSPAVTRAALTADPSERARLLRQVGRVMEGGALDTLDTQLAVGRAQSRLELPSQRTGSEFERLQELDRQGLLNEAGQARLNRLAVGSGGLTVTTLPDGTTIVQMGGSKGKDIPVGVQSNLIDQSLRTQQAVSLVSGMISKIQANQDQVGFEATLQNAVDRGVGVVSAIDSFMGTNLGALVDQGQDALQRSISAGRAADPRFQVELDRSLSEDIPSLEVESFLLAFAMRDALTPSGRFSYEAVKELEKRLSLKDARGPRAVIQKLRIAEKQLRDAERINQSRGKSLGIQIPTIEFDDSGAVAPAAEYEMTPDGRLVPVR